MFNPSRDEARRFFFDTWKKYRAGAPLTDLERIALGVIGLHGEYQALLEDERNIERDYTPEDGGVNPFLHLSLHLAIEEQLSIDQPPGLRAGTSVCSVQSEASTTPNTRCSNASGKSCGRRSAPARRRMPRLISPVSSANRAHEKSRRLAPSGFSFER